MGTTGVALQPPDRQDSGEERNQILEQRQLPLGVYFRYETGRGAEQDQGAGIRRSYGFVL